MGLKETIERRAAKHGMTLTELFEYDKTELDKIAQENKDCPTPDFLQSMDERTQGLLTHIASCPQCQTLLEMLTLGKQS